MSKVLVTGAAGSEFAIACAISGLWVGYYGYPYDAPISTMALHTFLKCPAS